MSDVISDGCSSDLHARRRSSLLAVNALGVLAADHLQATRRARELHALVGRGRHVLERDAAAADQVRRTWQDLQRGDPAGPRGQDALVLRPHRMPGPAVGGDRLRRLVAVAVLARAGAGVNDQDRTIVVTWHGLSVLLTTGRDRPRKK